MSEFKVSSTEKTLLKAIRAIEESCELDSSRAAIIRLGIGLQKLQTDLRSASAYKIQLKFAAQHAILQLQGKPTAEFKALKNDFLEACSKLVQKESKLKKKK